MSLTATARSIPGTLRQEIVIDGRTASITDEPERLGGEDSGPAPHELFPAALAACVSTTLVMYARTKGWDLGEVTVDVDYDHRSTPRRFEVAVALDGDLSDEQLERLEKVARACPLRRSIEAGFEFVETIECEASERRAAELVGGCIVSRKQIVILGGGTGGTMTANRLRRRFDADEAEIHVVDRDDRHVYQPGPALRPLRARAASTRSCGRAGASCATASSSTRTRSRRSGSSATRCCSTTAPCSRTTCSSSPAACGSSPRRPRA